MTRASEMEIKYLQKRIEASMFGPFAWTPKEIHLREHLRLRIGSDKTQSISIDEINNQ